MRLFCGGSFGLWLVLSSSVQALDLKAFFRQFQPAPFHSHWELADTQPQVKLPTPSHPSGLWLAADIAPNLTASLADKDHALLQFHSEVPPTEGSSIRIEGDVGSSLQARIDFAQKFSQLWRRGEKHMAFRPRGQGALEQILLSPQNEAPLVFLLEPWGLIRELRHEFPHRSETKGYYWSAQHSYFHFGIHPTSHKAYVELNLETYFFDNSVSQAAVATGRPRVAFVERAVHRIFLSSPHIMSVTHSQEFSYASLALYERRLGKGRLLKFQKKVENPDADLFYLERVELWQGSDLPCHLQL